MRSDQPWLEKGLQKFVVGKSFEIPEDKVDLVDGFLGRSNRQVAVGLSQEE